jgi:hypothetical protein
MDSKRQLEIVDALPVIREMHLDEQPFDKSKTAFHRVWDIQAGLID